MLGRVWEEGVRPQIPDGSKHPGRVLQVGVRVSLPSLPKASTPMTPKKKTRDPESIYGVNTCVEISFQKLRTNGFSIEVLGKMEKIQK